MGSLSLLLHPRAALEETTAPPPLREAVLVVVASGAASAALELAGTRLVSGTRAGYVLSALLPVFFPLYWLLNAWLIDAGASLVGRSGRTRAYLASSAFAFPALISFALLSLLEAVAQRFAGSGLASALGWLTLPTLAWFLALVVLITRAVYDIPTLNAFALALLPYAAMTGALLLLLIVLSALHAAGVT